jgi:hypothetical protein
MRKLLAAIIILLLATAGYSAYWAWTARQLTAEIGPWAAAQRAQGADLEWRRVSVRGFPASFRLIFEGVTASGAKLQPLQASAPLLTAEAAPWHLVRWHVQAPQGASASLPIAQSGAVAGTLDGTVTLGADETVIDLAADNLAGNGIVAGFTAASASLRLALPRHAPANHRGTALELALQLTGAALPWAVPPFGREIASLALSASLKGALPPGRLSDALAAWRADGGTVEVTEAGLRWGALTVTGSGTLALDDALQPIGAFTATVENQNAIVDAAVAAGNLRAGDANLIKIALGLMAKTGPDGQKQITVPVSLQNGRVYLGPAQIAILPRLTWE